ncbi:MAG: hypothetical protein F4Y86_03280 [Gammaproteobacteria bacterium]|nr:hypothetical protein [Gammaproteobacteria bacterium]
MSSFLSEKACVRRYLAVDDPRAVTLRMPANATHQPAYREPAGSRFAAIGGPTIAQPPQLTIPKRGG